MTTKTVFFMGGSTGVGLSALKHTLAAGHSCIALCRSPSKLSDILPAQSNPNLTIVEGNAHDINIISKHIKKQDGTFVDEIVSTIGGKPVMSKQMVDDPHVCRKGMAVLLEAISSLRQDGVKGRPLIVVCSTTGMSKFGRDVPLLMAPLYHVGLKIPHEDKGIMEHRLTTSEEDWAIVRCSFLTNGESERTIRVGVEDPETGRETEAIGYTISREDAGRWIAQHLIVERNLRYVNKIETITY